MGVSRLQDNPPPAFREYAARLFSRKWAGGKTNNPAVSTGGRRAKDALHSHPTPRNSPSCFVLSTWLRIIPILAIRRRELGGRPDLSPPALSSCSQDSTSLTLAANGACCGGVLVFNCGNNRETQRVQRVKAEATLYGAEEVQRSVGGCVRCGSKTTSDRG